jgi:flagellar export protein FliJ
MSRLRTVSRVIDLKARKKEEVEDEVRLLRAEIRQLETRLDALDRKFSTATKEFEEKQKRRDMDVHNLELFVNYFMNLGEEMKMQKKEIMRRLSELHERQNVLFEAYKEEKLLGILKDRIVREDTSHREKSEQKEQDFLHLAKRQREK